MAQIRVDNFGGLVLRKDPKKGPLWTALKASNCLVHEGSITPSYVLDPASEAVLNGVDPVKTLFNIEGGNFCQWPGDVDVAFSPISDNTLKRIYFTGDGVPKATDAGLATLNNAPPFPQVSYTLGLPIPKDFNNSKFHGALDLQVIGGAGPVETRAYCYTYVSPWGEEGPPSEPIQLSGNMSGVWWLRHIGALSHLIVNDGPLGWSCNWTWAAGIVTLTGGPGMFFRAGDLALIESTFNSTERPFRAAVVVGSANPATGDLKFRYDGVAPVGIGAVTVWRIGPLNTFNIYGALSFVSGGVNYVQLDVDLVEGLRKGDKIYVDDVVGMTDLNDNLYTVVDVRPPGISGTRPANIFIQQTTAQVYVSGGVAVREAAYNTASSPIASITWAAGVATVILRAPALHAATGGTAHMAVGDDVLIQGVLGAIEANGVRVVTAILSGISFTFALAAMTAYVDGGTITLAVPYPFSKWPITGVTLPAANTFRLVVTGDMSVLRVYDLVMGYDIGGAVEANNLYIVRALGAGFVDVETAYGAITPYTAGGSLVRVKHQVRKRVYRTNQALDGTADFQLVTTLGNEQCDVFDAVASDNLGDLLATDGWIQPPADLQGLVMHPHGFAVGFSKNILCQAEPYQPHAWPLAYQRPISIDIVGLGLYGTTIPVLTNDRPFNATGSHPTSITVVRQNVGEKCTSKRSVCSSGLGVAYRGTSGFNLLGYQGSNNATKNYLPPDGFINSSDTPMAYWGNRLVWIDNATLAGYVFDPTLGDKGLTQFDVDYPIYGLHVSPVDGQLWASYVKNGLPRRAPLFRIVASPARFTYWTQYLYVTKPAVMAFLQVDWTFDGQSAAMKDREAMIIRNMRQRAGRFASFNDHAMDDMAFNGDALETLYTPDTTLSIPSEKYLRVTVLASPDKADKTVTVFDDFVVNDEPIQMADGVKSDVWQIRLIGCADRVSAVSIASTVEELSQS